MRECWVIEEQNDNGDWYVIYSGGKVSAEEELARWPSTPENPKRLVRYVPAEGLAAKDAEIARLRAQVDEYAHLRSIVELYRSDPMAMADSLWLMREELGRLRAEKD